MIVCIRGRDTFILIKSFTIHFISNVYYFQRFPDDLPQVILRTLRQRSLGAESMVLRTGEPSDSTGEGSFPEYLHPSWSLTKKYRINIVVYNRLPLSRSLVPARSPFHSISNPVLHVDIESGLRVITRKKYDLLIKHNVEKS